MRRYKVGDIIIWETQGREVPCKVTKVEPDGTIHVNNLMKGWESFNYKFGLDRQKGAMRLHKRIKKRCVFEEVKLVNLSICILPEKEVTCNKRICPIWRSSHTQSKKKEQEAKNG